MSTFILQVHSAETENAFFLYLDGHRNALLFLSFPRVIALAGVPAAEIRRRWSYRENYAFHAGIRLGKDAYC